MVEKWKDIEGFDGEYQVSNTGKVRVRQISYKEISPTDNGHGYKIVGLKRKNHYVHRLVADAFIENPNNYPQVNHIDYNTNNNRADNLEWCTPQQNINHSIEHLKKPKMCKTNTGEHHITLRKNGLYRVNIRTNGVNKEKCFSKLEDAIRFRDRVYGKGCFAEM